MMNLQHSPCGLGSFAAARFKITRNDFVIGYADYHPVHSKFVFVPAQFVPMSEIMQRCQRQRLPDKEFDAAIDRHEREMKAAVLSPEELLIVKDYVRNIPDPEEQRVVAAVEQDKVDKRSKLELEQARDNLIREIGSLTAIKERLEKEIR
jgi:hypothetical protein